MFDFEKPIYINPYFDLIDQNQGTALILNNNEQEFQLEKEVLDFIYIFKTPIAFSSHFDKCDDEIVDLTLTLLSLGILKQEGFFMEYSPSSARYFPEQTFFNLPSVENVVSPTESIGILGVRYDEGTLNSYEKGSSKAPDALRRISNSYPIKYDIKSGEVVGWNTSNNKVLLENRNIFDAGDILYERCFSQKEYYSIVNQVITNYLMNNNKILTIGGDHSISKACIEGYLNQYDELGVIYFDAHTDLMEINHKDDIHHGNVFRWLLKNDGIKSITQIGVRGIQTANIFNVSEKYQSFSTDYLRENKLINLLNNIDKSIPYYISIDVDVLDGMIFPATPSPMPDGLFLCELITMLNELHSVVLIVGGDIVEYLPLKDDRDLGSRSVLEIVLNLMECFCDVANN